MVEATATRELKCDLAADVIRRFGVLRLRVSGFSMLPSIWPGDIACVSRVAAYRPGDVVLFSRNGRLFVHRVVEMSGGAVFTRGDSMLDADPPVALSDVLGRVESIERGGSRVAVAREVSWGSRVVGAVLGQSGRLVRLFVSIRGEKPFGATDGHGYTRIKNAGGILGVRGQNVYHSHQPLRSMRCR